MGWRNRRTWDEPPEEEIQEECSCGKCRWDTFDHTGTKPVQYGYFGLWASGAITVSSEPAAVADYLSSQIKKQIQED